MPNASDATQQDSTVQPLHCAAPQVRWQLALAGVTLVLCTAINLTSPVLSGMLFDTLVQRQPLEQYAKLFGVLLAGECLT